PLRSAPLSLPDALPICEIVGLIRGKRGTSVTIKVRQPNTPDTSARNVTVVRDIIQQEESGVKQRVVEVQRPNIDKTPKRIGVLEDRKSTCLNSSHVKSS